MQIAYIQKHGNLTSIGGKPIQKPLVAIDIEGDPLNSPATVKLAIEKITQFLSSTRHESVWLSEVRHSPALEASQRSWMVWIANRFADIDIPPVHRMSRPISARPSGMYKKDQTEYFEAASRCYQIV